MLVHSVLWAVALNTHSGFRAVSPTRCGWSGATTASRACATSRQILMPAAFPSILTGLKIGWAFAWRTLIAAELVFGVSSGTGGLGWFIFENRTSSISRGLRRPADGHHHRPAGRERDLPHHREPHRPPLGHAGALMKATTMKPVIAAICALLLSAAGARAEVNEIRFAQQFSMGYLQFNMMAHRKLLEKHAALLGIPELKVRV